ncbi:MAG: hypothetical protein ABUJ92_00545 [Desulfobacterales bacterium]
MATLPELERALVNADAAGDVDAARKLAAVIQRARADVIGQIPAGDGPAQIFETQPQQPEPTLGEQAVGVGETALATATGATGGMVGMIGGTLKGLAEQILAGEFGTQEAANLVQQSAQEGAQALTFTPRTPVGQEMTQSVAQAAEAITPILPVSGGLAAIPAGLKAAAPIARAAGAEAIAPVRGAVQRVAETLKPTQAATPGTMPTVGAAGVDMATLRQAKAAELPVPINLTEGQKTRAFEQQRFEREAAKAPEVGEPIRQRFAEQNMQLNQNLDAMVDKTGAAAGDLRSIGLTVDKALRDRAARDKTKIRTLYKEAEKSGEMEAPVTLDNVVRHIVDSAPEAEVANVLKAVKAKALQLGVAIEDSQGGLTALPVKLRDAELFRKSINAATNAEPTNIRQASIMKGLIDDQTADVGGALYKRARDSRVKYAKDYENIGLIKNLIGKKRGTSDRAIAMEDVLRRSIIEPSASLDTIRQVRRLLQTEGANGKQAWKELQGGTLNHIKEQATKNVARDELGNPIVSAAQLDRTITQLDRSGKLDFIFGKKGAEQLRTINDVAKDVLTAPPGSVNTSNTASVVLAAMDMAISGTAGVPAPILTSMRLIGKGLKDAKTKARIKRAIGE